MLLFVVSAVAAVPLEVAVDAHARIDAAELAVRPDADVPVSALEDAARGVPHTGSALRDHGYSVWGVVVVDAPLEQVWAALGDEEVHPRYTATRWAAVVQGERCHSQRLVVMVRPTPVIADRWWVARMVETRPSGAVREVMWELLSDWTPPAELAERLEGAVRVRRGGGAWHLARADEQTLLRYVGWVDPESRVPASVLAGAAARAISRTMGALQELVADGVTRCPAS